MKNIGIGLTLCGLLLASSFAMAHGNRGYSNHSHSSQYRGSQYRGNQAVVVNITPVYYRSRGGSRSGYGHCTGSHRDHTGAIIGGIIGGVIGNEIGDNRSRGRRNSATAAGVIVGAAVGNRYDQRHSSGSCVSKSRGAKSFGVRNLKGYKMTYKYRGRLHSTFVTRRPPQYFRIDQLGYYS